MRHCLFKALVVIVLGSTVPFFADDFQAFNEVGTVWAAQKETPETGSAGVAFADILETFRRFFSASRFRMTPVLPRFV